MHRIHAGPDDAANATMVRIGGAAILIGLAIHIFLNMFFKQFPPDNPTVDELKAYLTAQSGTWAAVHGLRYIAFLCIALFGAGLFVRTSDGDGVFSNAWGVVGLLGCAMWLSSAIVTNGIEILAFIDISRLSSDASHFWMLFHLTRVLWTAEIAAWAILIFGFCAAGWRAHSLPRWLVLLGFFSAAAQMLSALFIVSILNNGAAAPLVEVGSISGLVWYLCAGVFLLLRGARRAHDSSPQL